MKAGVPIVLVGAVLATGAAATAVDWPSASAPSGAFSVQTPCNSSEVAAFSDMSGDKLPGGQSDPSLRVVCMKGKFMFVASLLDLKDQPGGSRAFFDGLVKSMASDKTARGTPSWTTIDGRRAWVNRQQSSDRVAQTGAVEVSSTKVIMLTAGAMRDSGLSIGSQVKMVDRFYASLKVGG